MNLGATAPALNVGRAVLPAGRLRVVLAALAAQALATQLLFATVW